MSNDEKWIKGDPFYRLLVAPNKTFEDNKDVKLIDMLLQTGFDMIYTKCGKTRIGKQTHIKTIFKLLLSPKYDGCDSTIKMFALLFILNHEPELANTIEKFYDRNGGLFQEKGPQIFRKAMIEIKSNINKTFECAYNQANIIKVVEEFMYYAHIKYTCG